MARRGENIFKRKDGRWEARCIVSYENGKAKYCYLYGKSYKEAKEKKKLVLLSVRQNGNKEDKKAETFETLADEWLKDRSVTVKESTYTRYYRIVKRYLVPILKDKKLSTINQAMVNSVSTELLTRGGTNGRCLSSKTVSDILCVLKAILQYGTEHAYPCSVITHIRYPQRRTPRINIYTSESRIHLEQCLQNSEDTLQIGIFLTLYTGIRIGELCGLRWGDIDFANAFITISRTVERIADLTSDSGRKTKVILGEPKTDSSKRIIPIPSFLLSYLKAHQQKEDFYLLTNSNQYTEPHQFYMRYRRFLEKNEIGNYTFHALRHTFATRCVEMGFDIKSLSEILGHSNITTTLSIYVHPSLQQKKQQMEMLASDSYLQSKL